MFNITWDAILDKDIAYFFFWIKKVTKKIKAAEKWLKITA
jgi:hypothetical protein